MSTRWIHEPAGDGSVGSPKRQRGGRSDLACASGFLLAVAMLFLARTAAAQPPRPKPLPGDAAIERFLRDDTAKLQSRFLDGAKSLKEWQERLPRLRREYLDMLGLWPLPEKTPLKAAVTGKVERGEVMIENLHFQSRPGLYVTGNLYRPKEANKKLPTILYVCGHSGRGRDGNKTAFQDHGMWFARNGYVCLVIDTLQLGEIAGKHHGTYNLGRWWWHSLGYTPAGVECWNGVRAIDYLVSRPDVDADRIGITGISGGGAATFWIAAADDRVKVAVPVSGMSDLESYVSNRVIDGHCDCMFLYNLYRWEWTTIAALVAPRPMLFANSDNDRIFPMDGNRRIIARLRELYKMYGKPDLVDEYVSKGGHAYRPDLRIAVFKWIDKHLAGRTGEVKDADDKPLPGKQMRVFPEDADIPKHAINGKADETFVAAARVKLPEAKEFAAWQKGMIQKLREGPFRNLGKVSTPTLVMGDSGLGEVFVLQKSEGAAQSSVSRTVAGGKASEVQTLIVMEDKPVDPRGLRKVAGDGTTTWLSPRGVGDTNWTRRSPPNYVERAHALLGRTADLGRVHDILATLKHLDRRSGKAIRIVGRGQAGILAAYAALLEPSIDEVVVIDPPASHREGPHFLGVLRVLDIPEALGLLAPRKLTLLGASDPAFDRTAEIYKLAGAADKLTRPMPSRSRIDPAGIGGELLLSNGEVADAVIARFVERAGGEKARVLVLTTAGADAKLLARLREACKEKKASLEVRAINATDDDSEPDVKGATGVWLLGKDEKALKQAFLGGRIEQGCRELLARGGVLAAGDVGNVFLPDAVVGATDALTWKPGSVGYEIGAGATLSVRGRRLGVLGDGKVTVHLAAGGGRTARTVTLGGKAAEDLTALRRAARDRAGAPYPAARPVAPVVEKGTLVIVGGGGMPAGLIDKFVELAGGKKAHIVILPTAMPDPLPTRDGIARSFRDAGAAKVTVLKGRTQADVESAESLAALKEATGIWFGGGRQWRFVDAYEGTKAVPLMFDVLKRGGVIGGSSAGATIQGEYLCRGGVFNNFDIVYEGYERGLNFLPGVAIDQHFAQRKRFKDMTTLMKVYPQLLGIGIDETTALIVQGAVAEVVGKGQAHFYDRTKPAEKDKPDHESVGQGGRYDLKERKVLATK